MAEWAKQRVPVQRILLIVAVPVSWLGPLAPGHAILRIFTPLIILVFVSWATFFLEEFRKRIDIAGSNFLLFAAFNFAILNDLPRLGYMTFLDFILVAMFIITGLIIVFNVRLRQLRIKDKDALARKIDAYALKWVYPFV